MPPTNNHSAYSLYKKPSKDGLPVWYARFWDGVSQRYAVTRSTGVIAEGKRERKPEADQMARKMLGDIKFRVTLGDMLFTDFLRDFWREDSKYAREHALVYKKPLSKAYIRIARGSIDLYVVPYSKFKNMILDELTPASIRDWMTWAAEKGLSGKRINTVFEAMRVAVRWAYMREEIPHNPFALIKKAYHECRERGVLTPQEAIRIISLEGFDPFRKLVALLGLLCGMRCGEIRGLQWGDIDVEGRMIDLRHNFVANDGLKGPKAGSSRKIPIVDSVLTLIMCVKARSLWHEAGDYVFSSDVERGKPRSPIYFRYSLELVLIEIEVTKEMQVARNLTLHGLRHTFVTLGRLSGIPDLVIQALAGHKSSAMMEHYSHASQVIDFDEARKRLESIKDAKRNVVG
ncbi:MAG TPA: site-specific integrase [Treponemataceae bacterium]|nr:site-specific integrase [Treponemataceae bacterium]